MTPSDPLDENPITINKLTHNLINSQDTKYLSNITITNSTSKPRKAANNKSSTHFLTSGLKNYSQNLIYSAIGIGTISLMHYLNSTSNPKDSIKSPENREKILKKLQDLENTNLLLQLSFDELSTASNLVEKLFRIPYAKVTYDFDTNDDEKINVLFQLNKEDKPILLRSLKIKNLIKFDPILCNHKNCDGSCEFKDQEGTFHGDFLNSRLFEVDSLALLPKQTSHGEPQGYPDLVNLKHHLLDILPLNLEIPYLAGLANGFEAEIISNVRTKNFPPYFWPETIRSEKDDLEKNQIIDNPYTQWINFVEIVKNKYSIHSFLETATLIDFKIKEELYKNLEKIKSEKVKIVFKNKKAKEIKISKHFSTYLDFMFFYRDLDSNGRIPNLNSNK